MYPVRKNQDANVVEVTMNRMKIVMMKIMMMTIMMMKITMTKIMMTKIMSKLIESLPVNLSKQPVSTASDRSLCALLNIVRCILMLYQS